MPRKLKWTRHADLAIVRNCQVSRDEFLDHKPEKMSVLVADTQAHGYFRKTGSGLDSEQACVESDSG